MTAYGNSTTLDEKHEAGGEMVSNVSLIRNPTLREKMNRLRVKSSSVLN